MERRSFLKFLSALPAVPLASKIKADPLPLPEPEIIGVDWAQEVATHGQTMFKVMPDGRVYAYGINTYGRLGTGADDGRIT